MTIPSIHFMRSLKFSPKFLKMHIGNFSLMGEKIHCPWTNPYSKDLAVYQMFSKKNATYLF